MLQTLPSSAEAYSRTHRQAIASTTAQTVRLWSRMTPDFDASWARIEPLLMALVGAAQRRAARDALDYVPAVLEDTGQLDALDAAATVNAAPLYGVAGDGRPVDTLLYGAVTHAKTQVGAGLAVDEALASGRQWLGLATTTLLADTARAAESLAMGVRPVRGYVRMVVPPACSRCVILAGKWFSRSTGFLRHPRCKCVHIPASEALAGDLTVDSDAYVESLSAAEQDRLLGAGAARAWREGADLNQLVNARRGMRTAQIGGRKILITSEGTTRRGWAYDSLAVTGTRVESAGTAIRVTREGREVRSITRTVARRPRLMPETIAAVADDREDYLRLLERNGYITNGWRAASIRAASAARTP